MPRNLETRVPSRSFLVCETLVQRCLRSQVIDCRLRARRDGNIETMPISTLHLHLSPSFLSTERNPPILNLIGNKGCRPNQAEKQKPHVLGRQKLLHQYQYRRHLRRCHSSTLYSISTPTSSSRSAKVRGGEIRVEMW